MKSYRSIVALCIILASGPLLSQEYGVLSSASDYIEELDRIAAEVNSLEDPKAIHKLLLGLPPQWHIRIGPETFSIDSGYLLSSFSEEQNPSSVKKLLARIAALKRDMLDFQSPPGDISAGKKALADILARPEFNDVRGPTAWDRFKEKVRLFLLKILGGIFGSSSFPIVGRIFIWTLVGLAFLALSVWIYRILRKGIDLEMIALNQPPAPAASWSEWMSEAQSAAANGHWRDAVHMSYRTGISFLEARGLWQPDQSRTPREYVRLIGPTSEYRNPLSALTRMFEAVWYGHAAAGPDSYSEALNCLENMGCRSN